MKRGLGYLPEGSVYPLGGLNTQVPSTLLEPSYSPYLQNVKVTKGHVVSREGYHTLGGTVDGTPIAIIRWQLASGTESVVLVTTTKMYEYDAANDAWKNVTKQAGGSDVDWTGDETDVVDWCVATGTQGTWLLVTNGKDQLRYWDGQAARFEDLVAATGFSFPGYTTGVFTCKTLAAYNQHVVLGGPSVNGSAAPRSIAWSRATSLVDFTTSPAGSGLLTEFGAPISRLLKLGDRLAVYGGDYAGLISYVGGTGVMATEVLLRDTRLVSPRAIVDLGPFHLFAGRDNLYVFDGTRLMRPIGDAIQNEFRDAIQRTTPEKVFAWVDQQKNEVYFGVPTETGTVMYVLEYDTMDASNMRWSKHRYAIRPTCLGLWVRSGSVTCDGLPDVPVDSLGSTCDNPLGVTGYPVPVMGTETGVVVLDEVIALDGETAIESVWDSKDFVIPVDYKSEEARWLEAELELRGTAVEVWISTDEGRSFELMDTLSLTERWTRYPVPFDKISRTLRIRLRTGAASQSFEFRWLRVWFRAVGSR